MRFFNGKAGLLLQVSLAVMLGAGVAMAQTPQTIVIDGVNDFLPGNLVESEGGDTQHTEIDLVDFYLTNDAVNLFVGVEHDQGGFGTVQIGLAIDVDTPAGGDTDPWGRAIEWSAAPNKPDFVFYVNLDNNWQASYQWNGTSWDNIVQGPNALGMATGTSFRELSIMLGALGISASDVVNYEAWVTQDGGTKGPLDLLAGDADQLSTPGFTLWDTPTPIALTSMKSFTVLAAADLDPPQVVKVEAGDFPAESFFDVYFTEPVEQTSAETIGNYSLPGGTVTAALRDASDPSIVHLTMAAPLPESASLYTLTVTGVQDLATNTIVNDGVGNVACFMLKKFVVRGLFGPYIANLLDLPPYQFSIEGDTAPFTFATTCDTGMMADTGLDDIWEFTTTVLVNGDCVGGTATANLEWKFMYNCTTYEPLASNRVHTFDLANGAIDTVEVYWNDEDPSQFTLHDIDVEFFVDMTNTAYLSGDTVSLNGSVPPLAFNVPSLLDLVDDGTGNDAVAGDKIFSTLVTFPTGSKKSITYKYLLNDVYECGEQGDRDVFLNDEVFDTVGGTLGPLTLPVVFYDFCGTIWSPVEVHFQVDARGLFWNGPNVADVLSVNGTPNNADPPDFDWTVPSLNPMTDDGIYPDAVAGDDIYTVSVIFPDTSAINIEYKFLFNEIYECIPGNRTASLDPTTYDAVGNPQILPVAVFYPCGISPVPDLAGLLSLQQNIPNPFNPSTEIKYNVPRAGKGSLRVFNVRGELVRTLRTGDFASGPGSVVWDGRSDDGKETGSGVYFYRLEVGTDQQTKRMVLLK